MNGYTDSQWWVHNTLVSFCDAKFICRNNTHNGNEKETTTSGQTKSVTSSGMRICDAMEHFIGKKRCPKEPSAEPYFIYLCSFIARCVMK